LRGAAAVARRSRSKLGATDSSFHSEQAPQSPGQILIPKFKTQNPFGHLDFGHLILLSISDLEFGLPRLATPEPALREIIPPHGACPEQNDKKRRIQGQNDIPFCHPEQ